MKVASEAKVLLRSQLSAEEIVETLTAEEVVARKKDLPADEIKEAAEVSKRSLEVVDKVSVGACELILLKVATARQEVPTAEEVVLVEETTTDKQPAALKESLAVEEKPAMAETIAAKDSP